MAPLRSQRIQRAWKALRRALDRNPQERALVRCEGLYPGAGRTLREDVGSLSLGFAARRDLTIRHLSRIDFQRSICADDGRRYPPLFLGGRRYGRSLQWAQRMTLMGQAVASDCGARLYKKRDGNEGCFARMNCDAVFPRLRAQSERAFAEQLLVASRN